ncbi:hypothetical protein BD626DRAFT_490731, partial [Schizophyllum amplum]
MTYIVNRTWAKDAFERICARPESLTDDEAEELPSKIVAAIARAREALLRNGRPLSESRRDPSSVQVQQAASLYFV